MMARFRGFRRSNTLQSSRVSNWVSLVPVISNGSGVSDVFRRVIERGVTSGPIFANLFLGNSGCYSENILHIQFGAKFQQILRRVFLVEGNLREPRSVPQNNESEVGKFLDVFYPAGDYDLLSDV